MPKKYRLLRELIIGGLDNELIVPIGTEFYPIDGRYESAGMFNKKPCLGRKLVENNPIFFEEIKEKERIEVRDVQYYGDKHRGRNLWTFLFNMNVDNIPSEKYQPLKDAMMRVLNNEQSKEETKYPPYLHDLMKMPQEERENWVHDFNKIKDFDFSKLAPKVETKNKEWEIVEFRYADNQTNRVFLRENDIYYYPSGMISGSLKVHLKEKKWLIHSVKRLSDGELFTVGENVGIDFANYENGDTIKGFEIHGNEMRVLFTPNPYWLIGHISHKKSTTTPLSGTMVTLEECERRVENGFYSGRNFKEGQTPSVFYDIAYLLQYPSYKDYQQSLK